MGYREIIKKIQNDSGFSNHESEVALDMLVETLAEQMPDDGLTHFASQLPAELQDIALSTALVERQIRHADIVEEFMDKEMIDEAHAKKQVQSAWEALKSFITERQVELIRSQLSPQVARVLP